MSVSDLLHDNYYNLICNDLTVKSELHWSGDVGLDDLTLSHTTDSSSTDSGTLIVAGGVGIAKNLNVGGNTSINGTMTVGSLVVSNGFNVGNLNVSGTLTAGSLVVNNGFNITDSTQSSSTLTGAFTVAGGVGIGKKLYVGGDVNISGSLNAGSFVFSGAVISDTTDTTTTGTGALTVAGGVGIGKNLCVGGGVYLQTTGNIPSPMTYYREFSVVFGLGGAVINMQLTGVMHRLNNIVTFCFVTISATATSTSQMYTNSNMLPPDMLPTDTRFCPIFVINDGQYVLGSMQFTHAGMVIIYVGTDAYFTEGETVGILGGGCSYKI